MSKVAVVTGSNKGIGLAIVKGLCERFDGSVYLTSRDVERGSEAVAELNKLGLSPEYHQLDVADRLSVEAFRDHIKRRHGTIDILVNNAAVLESALTPCDYEEATRVININYRSVLTMQELVYPLVRDQGRILNISSDCGHLSNLRNEYWIQRLSKKDLTVRDVNEFIDWFLESKRKGTFEPEDFAEGDSVAAYRASKVALSALTRVQARQLAARGVPVNALHPGLVRTDMTRGAGFLSAQQAAAAPLRLVLDAPPSLSGAYVWHDGAVLDWCDARADYYFKVKTLTA